MNSRAFILLLMLAAALMCCQKKNNIEWREYLGGPERNHYSPLSQINKDNVKQLHVAWEYHSRDSGQIQCNPIVVDAVLYAMTATVQPFALDAATGKELWRMKDSTGTTWYGTSRGVAYWEDGDDKRILYTKESWLYALNAKNGKPVLSFGDSGKVSLKTTLGDSTENKFVISNTPGTVYEDLIIMPMRLSEDGDAAPGNIQAFNIRTGKLAWVFRTIPFPGEVGYDTWPPNAYKNKNVGAANNWSGMSIDRKRGIVFVPTGSAAFDYYGGKRKGDNLFANCLLALNAKTGERIWHYQFVHHDVLDRDLPAPPNLITIMHDEKKIDAVAQITKHGYIFIFNRETGEPLFPIEERPVPQSDIPGEFTSATQPFPLKPLPFARNKFSEEDISPYAENKDELLEKLRAARNEGVFTPLSKNGTVIFPGLDGGGEWGGAAVDPDGIMYVNSNEMPWLISLHEKEEVKSAVLTGEQIYASNCSPCHGSERKGNVASGFPSLIDLNKRFDRDHVLSVVSKGKGMMPAFKKLSTQEQKVLIAFLFNDKAPAEKLITKEKEKDSESKKVPDYSISGFTKFLDNKGYPAINPPWGTLNAINLNTGDYVWKKTYGEVPELMAKGFPQTGSENYGGPIITESGLLFIAGTKDQKFRAYDKKTGELLWETKLPAAAFATPATYEVNGKQFVVIACGGTKLGAAKGESYVAFALP